jgi:hypothetical protein
MGLLDDAIREHLDLKRRRGADPAEVERLEREALGPVRRNTAQTAYEDDEPDLSADSPYDEPDVADAEAAYEIGDEPGPALEHEEWEFDDDRTRIVPPRDDEPVATEPADEEPSAESAPRAERESGSTQPPAVPEPAPGAPAPLDFAEDDEEPFADHEPPAGAGGETTEYDVERALAAEDGEEDEDEDVLEETPEFLQDTPDHDRLWFEQRPPRDFDFDG